MVRSFDLTIYDPRVFCPGRRPDDFTHRGGQPGESIIVVGLPVGASDLAWL